MAKTVEAKEDMPRIFLPLLEDEDGKADQTENVTINGKVLIIKRGEYVNVPQNVFVALKQKYPHL